MYGCGPVSLTSFLLCLLGFFIFSSVEFKKLPIFVYFRFECLFMSLDMLIKFVVLFIDRPNWSLWPTLFGQMFYTYCFIYISSVLEFCALGVNICAAFMCLAMIHPSNHSLTKLATVNPYLIILTWVIFSTLFYFYQAVSRNIFPIKIFVDNSRILGKYFKLNF